MLSIFLGDKYKAAFRPCQPKSANGNAVDQLINIEGQARLPGRFLEKKQLMDFSSISILKHRIFDDNTGLVCEEGKQINLIFGKVKGPISSVPLKHAYDILLDSEWSGNG
jgi:hypothetical protein